MEIKKSTLWIILIALVCFAIAAFRPYSMGVDTQRYAWMFRHSNFAYIDDYGFILLNRGLRIFTHNPRILFVVCSFLITGLFARSVIVESSAPLFSYILFVFLFYFASLNIMRQFVAVAIFYGLALPQVRQENLKKYLVYCFVAVSIHFSALILVFTYFINKLKIKRKTYLFAWGGSILLLIMPQVGVLKFIMSKVALVSSNADLLYYVNSIGLLFDAEKTNYYLYLLNCIYLFSLLNFKKISKDYMIFFKLFTLNILILNIFSQINIAARIDYILGISIIFVLAELAKSYKRWFPIMFIFFAALLFYYDYIIQGNAGVFNIE